MKDSRTSQPQPQPKARTFLFRHRNPKNTCVFATRNVSITRYLRRQGCWKFQEINCLPEEHPLVSTSCIISLPGKEVRIDEVFFVGLEHAENIRRQLTELHGLVDPDVTFVRAFAESRAPSLVRSFLERAFDKVID